MLQCIYFIRISFFADDGSLPNLTWLWDEYKRDDPAHVACNLVGGDVCAKYIYSFNGAGNY